MNTERFDEFYRAIYGSRWEYLRESLLLPPASVPYSDSLNAPYYIDRASILAALSLRLPPSDAPAPLDGGNLPEYAPLILDACAAPGGKSLVIAARMGKNSRLLSNDLSSERRRRLEAVLDRHLPSDIRSRVRVSGFDAAAAAGRPGERDRFAAILLDAPCSSERHVIKDMAALEKWTPARPRFLVRRQWALLSAAFLLLAPGASLVYATCSLNPEENDGVAAKLVKKYGRNSTGKIPALCIVDPLDFPEGEASEYGRLILPDHNQGCGPLYIARFKKGIL
jgi:16S rRNA (cytosine1407-C5)-methyltransferase